jgi:hypothetical protein
MRRIRYIYMVNTVMHHRKTILIIILLAGFYLLKAQDIDLYVVNIKGVVTSAYNGEPIPFARIVNPREHTSTTSNTDGLFSINMLTEDTLIIRSIGYSEFKFILREFPPKESYVISMQPTSYLLDEINVTGGLNLKKQLGLPDVGTLDIPIELRGNDFNKKPPLIAAFLTPISYLNYHLNEKEKEKRETLKAIQNNNEWLQFSNYFNLENIKRITGLKDEEADEFMIYCNLNNRLPYFASEMEIEFQFKDLFFKFKKAKESKKDIIQPKE